MFPKIGIFDRAIFYLALFAIDMLLRIVTLGFWLFNYQNFPQIPMFTKGIKFPEIQALIIFMELMVIVGTFLVQRNYQYLPLLKYLCFGFGTITLILSMFYSSNVSGSAGSFIFFVIYLNQTARENRLII